MHKLSHWLYWRSQGDSNPCFRREKTISLKLGATTWTGTNSRSRRRLGFCPNAAAGEGRGEMVSDDVGRAPQRVGVKVRISRRRRGLRMAQELPDDRKAEARARANRRESVPKIMDAHAFEARVPLYRPPRLLQSRPRPAHVSSRYDEGAAALAIPQQVHGGRAHDNCLSARLAVGQVDQPALKIDMAPLEGQDLLQPRAGEHEETEGQDDLC